MGKLSHEQLQILMANLRPGRVATRKQGGSTLSYLEAYDIRATLIRVFGFGNFSVDLIESEILRWETDIPNSRGGTTAFRVTAKATVRLTIHLTGATYTEAAIASQSGADPGEVADFAIKTAESDAMKRCATNLGTQFGLSLYNKGQTKDVVGVILDPDQKAALAGEWEGEDPTPDAALPAAVEEEKLDTLDKALEAWRNAKRALDSNEPGASPERVEELAELCRQLKDLEQPEPTQAEADDLTKAAEQMKGSFGG